MTEQFLLLFAVIGGAATVPFLSRRVGIPSAVLEIIYGIVLFNATAIHAPDWFHLLKELGFIYLMFIAGMELDLHKILQGRRLWWYLLIPALSLVLTPILFARLGYPFFLGIAVAVFSAGLVLPVLKEANVLQTPWGRDIIGVALSGELLSIGMLTVMDIYHAHGVSLAAALAGLKLILLMVLATLFLRLLYVFAWWYPQRVEKVMESEDPVEEGIRAVISIAFAGALIAAASGVEPILGSFMAGLIFSFVFKSKGRFEEKINAVGFGFFTPFFFIGVGAGFDVALLSSTDALLLALGLTTMVFVSKVFPMLFGRLMGHRPAESLGMSLILSAPLSLIVVAGALGRRMGLLSSETGGALVMTALLSGVVYPFLFRHLSRRLTPGSGKPDHP